MTFEPGEEVVDHLDRHVPEDESLAGGLHRPPAESIPPVIGDQRKVPSIHVGIG
jgi:hypothetical protein